VNSLLARALLAVSLVIAIVIGSAPAQAAVPTRTFVGQRHGASLTFRVSGLSPGAVTGGWVVVDGIRRGVSDARLKLAASTGRLSVSVHDQIIPAHGRRRAVASAARPRAPQAKLVVETRRTRRPAPKTPAQTVTPAPVTSATPVTPPSSPPPAAATTTPPSVTGAAPSPPVTTPPSTGTSTQSAPTTGVDGGPVGVALPVVPASAVYVSPSGSDSNPGTRDLPWRTLAKATSAAQPGQTVVLEPGTYGARGTRTNWTASGTATAPVVFIGDPTAGQRPTILGYNVLYGSHVQVWNMLFDGPTGSVDAPTSADPTGEDVMLWLTAPGIEIADSEIRNSLWHAGIYLTNADGDKLIGNYIHDNGNPNDPSQANLDHGIYWDDGNGGLIADNLITHNVAMGIQLYPSASNVTVDWNTIADNGKSGLIIAENSANNTIAHNIVANNSDNSIRSWSLTGTGNLVTNNIVWNNGNGNLGTKTDGLTLTANTQTNPDFLTGTYTPAAQSPATGQAGADESGLTSF
jgi:parallel beta-helix repeat protein